MKREGGDVTIVSYSYMVHTVLAAAERLNLEGIRAEVIDLRTLRPLDVQTLVASVRKTHRAVIVHEACITGGFGAEIVSRIVEEAFDYLDAPLKRVGTPDVPIPYAKTMEDFIFPNEQTVMTAVKDVLYKL